MIPKVIHYCWFGGKPLPKLAIKCIESWKKFCPDYEIKEWNENNFDLNISFYTKEAYEEKKWAFITDYVRLYALVNEGGVYMDTDVEVIGSLDAFLSNKAFSGFENEKSISTGIMACEKGFPLFSELLRDYDNRHFILEDGSLDITTNVVTITKLCQEYGFVGNNTYQNIVGFALYPMDFFCPKDQMTGRINSSVNTVTIHHFSGSWINLSGRISRKIQQKTTGKGKFIHLIGILTSAPFKLLTRIKKEGIKKTLIFYINKYSRLKKY